MQIRDASIADAPQVAALLSELGYPATSDFASDKLRLFGGRGASRVLIAEEEEEAAGIICFDVQPLFHQEGNIGCIMALCVASEHRGRGIGRALVERIERIAVEMGCIKIAVASGLQREDAHRFYRSLGYEEITKRFVKSM